MSNVQKWPAGWLHTWLKRDKSMQACFRGSDRERHGVKGNFTCSTSTRQLSNGSWSLRWAINLTWNGSTHACVWFRVQCICCKEKPPAGCTELSYIVVPGLNTFAMKDWVAVLFLNPQCDGQ